jgi:hypothetical protein
MTVEEFCEKYKVYPTTVRRWCTSGDLVAHKVMVGYPRWEIDDNPEVTMPVLERLKSRQEIRQQTADLVEKGEMTPAQLKKLPKWAKVILLEQEDERKPIADLLLGLSRTEKNKIRRTIQKCIDLEERKNRDIRNLKKKVYGTLKREEKRIEDKYREELKIAGLGRGEIFARKLIRQAQEIRNKQNHDIAKGRLKYREKMENKE